MRNGFLVADYVVCFTLPGVAMLLMFGSLSLTMIRRKAPTHSKKDVKRLLMSVLLFVFYFGCHLPAEIIDTMMYRSNSHLAAQLWLQKAVETLSLSHGLLNIIAYVLCSPELHSSLWKKLSRQKLDIPSEHVPVLVRDHIVELR